MMRILHYIFILLVSYSCTAQSPVTQNTVASTITSPLENIRFVGRVKHYNDSAKLYWPGTSAIMRFEGRGLEVKLNDENDKNHFNIVIDNEEPVLLKLKKGNHWYTLAADLTHGIHVVQLIKRNEWDKGYTTFLDTKIDNGTLLTAPPVNKRIIEFYGNSITAGYAIDDNTGKDSPDSTFTNNYYTYGALTARHFNADYYAVVKSGIGLMVSWFPLIMPELYDRIDPNDPSSKWDFSKVQPQVVVINLFQNDSWLISQNKHSSFKQRFGHTPPTEKQIVQAYVEFVSTIRSKYPHAHIVCALGSMDITKPGSPWPNYVQQAVDRLNDPKVHSLFFPYTAKQGHPRREDNARMAKQLIAFIEEKVGNDW